MLMNQYGPIFAKQNRIKQIYSKVTEKKYKQIMPMNQDEISSDLWIKSFIYEYFKCPYNFGTYSLFKHLGPVVQN